MRKYLSSTTALALGLTLSGPCVAQSLQAELDLIAKESGGKLYTACALASGSRHTPLACDREADAHPPMQSVFKLPLGIYALHLVEEGKLQLDQPVHFGPQDRFVPKSWSPLQDKYPDANVDVPLREVLQLAVSQSDNVAADLALRVVGGTEPVQQYIHSLGVQGFVLRHTEHELHRDERLQYQDWFSPHAAVQLLRRLADQPPLNAEHMGLLLQWMQATRLPRLATMLPAGTVVAHKTGTSGMENGIAAATNDIGLVTLPDGERLAIAIFLSDSTADDATRDRAIGRAALAIFQAATSAKAGR
ncbi:class A beta-lactamase [Terriglobus aquaticus]|uniref:beta-lactamase n=1 Tax=Terriglobus aquaticus TaxID=940139 RepID=A0ABW9KPH8_9BACT|nr:class A beta-lactamase [Terriglobus aquaticus]